MPKIRLLPLFGADKKTPGFTGVLIDKYKKEGLILDTIREDMNEGQPSWRIKFPGDSYEWYVYKSETQIVRKPTVILEEHE